MMNRSQCVYVFDIDFMNRSRTEMCYEIELLRNQKTNFLRFEVKM